MILVKKALEFNESLNKLCKYPFEELSPQTKYLYIYLFYIFKYVSAIYILAIWHILPKDFTHVTSIDTDKIIQTKVKRKQIYYIFFFINIDTNY